MIASVKDIRVLAQSVVLELLQKLAEFPVALFDMCIHPSHGLVHFEGIWKIRRQLDVIGIEGWRVITKLPEMPKDCDDIDGWINKQMEESLGRRRVKSVTGLMIHRPMQLLEKKGENIWQALNSLKENKIIGEIGYSIYDPSELDKLWDNFKPDIIQAPFNVLDRRLETSGWLTRLHDSGTEIHVRSVFLQGLLLIHPQKRPEQFSRWSALWNDWENWLEQHQISSLRACVQFALNFPQIDRVVLGVDSVANLEEILANIDNTQTLPELTLECSDPELINPSLWNLSN